MSKKNDDMIPEKGSQDRYHPLFGLSFWHWCYLLVSYRGYDRMFFPQVLFITIMSILTTPMRFAGWAFYHLKIKPMSMQHPPIFIIGHWRSGTTFLHELLCMDQDRGYVSLWHTLLPTCFMFFEPFKTYMGRVLPETRPMDNIRVAIDGPYEEEAGLATMGPHSFFHCIYFPRMMKTIFPQVITVSSKDQKIYAAMKKQYLKLLKIISWDQNGKQLVIKNPALTGRIELLLDLFPNARFIHIYRNPYTVYHSTQKMRRRTIERLALQQIPTTTIEQQVIENYKTLHTTYFAAQHLIPPQHYIEIKYEDLVKKPMNTLKKIFSQLDLNGFDQAKPFFQQYLDQKKSYKTNVYHFDEQSLKVVQEQWKLTLEKWSYQPPH